MADYRLWGRIEQIGPHEFLAIVSAIPADGRGSPHARVETRLETSLDAARDALRSVLVGVGLALGAEGARVTDTETDGL